MLIYEMFDIIANSAVGNLGNMGLVTLQLYMSMFFEAKFLFDSMKSKSPLVKVSISLIPLVLIMTYSIACGIIFSSFLGNGPKLKAMTALVQITLSKECIFQMMTVVTAFFALMIIYSAVYHLKPLPWIMTFGTELLASISLLVLYGGLLTERFPFTILDLCYQDIYLARLPIYGYFILLFKCCVLIISLFLGFLLRNRKAKEENEEEKYKDRRGYCEKKVLKFLTKDVRVIGISTFIFGMVAVVFFTWRILLDKTTIWDIGMIFTMLAYLALFLAPVVIGLVLIYRAMRPRTTKAYRQLLTMGDKDTVLRLFCEEIVESNPTETKLQFNDTEIRTTHFILRRQGIKVWVVWRE